MEKCIVKLNDLRAYGNHISCKWIKLYNTLKLNGMLPNKKFLTGNCNICKFIVNESNKHNAQRGNSTMHFELLISTNLPISCTTNFKDKFIWSTKTQFLE